MIPSDRLGKCQGGKLSTGRKYTFFFERIVERDVKMISYIVTC
jgi:hypothetical protein